MEANDSFSAYRKAYEILLGLAKENQERYNNCPLPFVEESQFRAYLKSTSSSLTDSIINSVLEKLKNLGKIDMIKPDSLEARVIIPLREEW